MKKDWKLLLLFVPLTAVYFHDAFLKGLILAFGDGMLLFYPKITAVSQQYRDFTFPFWNPYEFSGLPLFAGSQFQAMYPPTVLPFLIFSGPVAYNVDIMLHFALAGSFTFLFARQLGIKPVPSLIAGILFSMLGFMPPQITGLSLITTVAWLPAIFYCYERLRQSPDAKHSVLASFPIALQVYAGHPQICAYTCLFIAMFVMFHFFYLERDRKAAFLAYGLLAFALGMVFALPQLSATGELARFSGRDKVTYEYFSLFSLGLDMLPTFIFPFLYGGGYAVYAGMTDSPIKIVQGFVGILPLFLALVVFLRDRRKNPHILFFGLAATISLILAMGSTIGPLNRFLYHMPVFNLFRYPNRHLLEVSFSIAILTGFGLSMLTGKDGGWYRKSLSGIMLLLITATVLSFTVFKDQINRLYHVSIAYRPVLSLSNPIIFVPLISMAAYLLCLVIFFKKERLLSYSILAVIFLEAFSYRVTAVYPLRYPETYRRDLFQFLAEDRTGRVAFPNSVRFSALSMTYGISTIEGFDTLYIKDYGKLLCMSQTGQSTCWYDLVESNLLLSALNVKYIVLDGPNAAVEAVAGRIEQRPDGKFSFRPPFGADEPFPSGYFPVYRKVFQGKNATVYKNLNALPRAYDVNKLVSVETPEELRDRLKNFTIDPRKEAALSLKDLSAIGKPEFSSGEVAITDYRPTAVSLTADFPRGEGFVVLADQYYPGWRAYIDGKRVSVYKTNAVLRGIIVPAGRHEILFRYVPVTIYLTMAISTVALLAAAGYVVLGRRRTGPD